MSKQSEFFGMYDVVPFFGVVEDRNDPLNVGRVRVRVYAWHTENKADLPTDALPWAQVLMPVTSAAMSGIGHSPTGLVEGTTVFGYFMDGRSAQIPIIIGALPGINTTQSGQNDKGHQDPNGVYPKEINYPDTPKLAYDRWEEDDSIVTRNKNKITGIETTSGTWDEPEPRGGLQSQYPYNHTHVSESGHTREIDDTPGAERIATSHMSGSYEEIIADGSRATKIVGNDYEIVVQDRNVYVKGSCNITVGGDSTLYVKGNLIEQVDGDYTLTVTGNQTINAAKTIINNNVEIEGTSTASGDHVSNGISGYGHKHFWSGLIGLTSKPRN